jgi:hypothetical protein
MADTAQERPYSVEKACILRRHASGEINEVEFLRELAALDASRRSEPHWLLRVGGFAIAVLGILLVPASGRRD